LIFEKEDEMKKLLVVMLVLGMAIMANAAFVISVNGTDDVPDSEITLQPSETVMLGITLDPSRWQGSLILGILNTSTGSGSMDPLGATINYPEDEGVSSFVQTFDDADAAAALGVLNPMVAISLTDIVDPIVDPHGHIVDNILFHCEGLGDVVIGLFSGGGDDMGTLYDTQVIHQPEPMTVVLLGLGGLMLRRRK